MFQAIQTKYLGPANIRGARVKAWSQAKSLTLNWDHRLNPADNHIAAARALARQLDWDGVWSGGGLPNGGYAFVLNESVFIVAPSKVVA